LASAPKMNASPRPATMVAIRGVSCGIVYGAPFKNRDVGCAPPEGAAFSNMVEGVQATQPARRKLVARAAEKRKARAAKPLRAPIPNDQ
jgi:hypothetical protein